MSNLPNLEHGDVLVWGGRRYPFLMIAASGRLCFDRPGGETGIGLEPEELRDILEGPNASIERKRQPFQHSFTAFVYADDLGPFIQYNNAVGVIHLAGATPGTTVRANFSEVPNE